MEISEQTIVRLIENQAATTQAVEDLKNTLEKTIPFLVDTDKENAEAIKGVERKVWYFGGAGSVLGFIGTEIVKKYFGGK